MGTLFVVSTPIGNLEDITYRAIRILDEVDLILAEDTRRTRILLDHYGVRTKLTSYHAFNERASIARVIAALVAGDVALVSDAGTPGISDPGRIVVEAVIELGHQVLPIPGPSAVTAAISAAGIIDGPFLFLGFLPRKGAERREQLSAALDSGYALVVFESPHRLRSTLGELHLLVPDRKAVLFREMTKHFEERIGGTVAQVAKLVQEKKLLGEMVLVVGSGSAPAMTEAEVDDVVRDLASSELRLSDAARLLAERIRQPRSAAYELLRDHRDRANDSNQED